MPPHTPQHCEVRGQGQLQDRRAAGQTHSVGQYPYSIHHPAAQITHAIKSIVMLSEHKAAGGQNHARSKRPVSVVLFSAERRP